MRHVVSLSGKQLLLTTEQFNALLLVVQDAEHLTEIHVGNGKGSQGYSKAYNPGVETKQPHEWLESKAMTEDYVDAIKLTMKLAEQST